MNGFNYIANRIPQAGETTKKEHLKINGLIICKNIISNIIVWQIFGCFQWK